jgi:hypothetical protein
MGTVAGKKVEGGFQLAGGRHRLPLTTGRQIEGWPVILSTARAVGASRIGATAHLDADEGMILEIPNRS